MARLVWQLLPIGDFENIGAIKTMNEHHQRFFFSEGAMAFFNSRIEPKVYSGCVFVTSESPQQLHPLGRTDDQRRWSVRIALDNGAIETFGDFCWYKSLSDAQLAAENLGLDLRRLDTLFVTLHKTDEENNEFERIAARLKLEQVTFSEVTEYEKRRRNHVLAN